MPATSNFRAAVAVMLALVAACERAERAAPPDIGPIAVAHDRLTVRTDTVGHDRWESRATFVLVDADNPNPEPGLVTLSGLLVDADGREVGRLRAETLWVPARGRRTFALIDDRREARATAVAARVDVRGARRPTGAEPVVIDQGHVWSDYGKVVATAMVVNRAKRPCKAMVFAGFHDAAGKPMTRPFTVFELGPEVQKPARFVGPPGSATGYIFLGEIRC